MNISTSYTFYDIIKKYETFEEYYKSVITIYKKNCEVINDKEKALEDAIILLWGKDRFYALFLDDTKINFTNISDAILKTYPAIYNEKDINSLLCYLELNLSLQEKEYLLLRKKCDYLSHN